MAKNIRSNYIKNLMVDKDTMDATLRESTKDALKDIVDEAVNKNLRAMITEAEDEYDEEEVNPEKELETASTDTKDEEGKGENPFASDDEKGGEGDEKPLDTDTEGAGEGEAEDTTDAEGEGDGEDVWNSIEQYKDMEGEYDLTGMGSEDVVKVLRVMKPEDGIRVVKNGDEITLTDDNADTEYIIQIEADEPEEDNFEYEVEVGDGVEESYGHINEYDSHVGYTDNYQKQTAMTTPPNNEPANPKSTYSMDAGVPKGTEKPWAGDGDDSPFTEKPVNEGEGCIGEEEQLDEHSGPEGFVGKNSTAKTHHNTNQVPETPRNGSEGGQHVKPTSVARYSTSNESLRRKANIVFNENKQLKEIAEQIKERLQEACTINASLGKIIKLITENTTTRDEKIDIVNRFNDVKSINESNQLYETISRELQNAHPINNVNNVINGQQLAESKRQTIVETSMYQSEDLNETIDFMKRLDKIKK